MSNSSNDAKRKRQERLEAQLRENLKRRREQARARRELDQPVETAIEEPLIDRSEGPDQPPATD